MPEERKLVTILFADIVGSTAMTGAHDPELVRATMDEAFDRVAPILEEHGGTVEKFIGDAVMAVFGIPRAHDDDAERALRAAFAIRAAVAGLDQALKLEVRVGVNTGEAVTRGDTSDQRFVTGIAVNLAQRLQAAAQPGEILAGPVTHDLTKRSVRFEPERRLEAKGIGETSAYPAGELLDAVPEQHRGLPGLRAPLIGRDRELGLLSQAYERAGAEGTPSLVTVFGAAGAGKSRLTADFLDAIGRERARVGRCLPYGQGITFYPLQLVLREDAGFSLTDDREAARAKLRDAVRAAVPEDEVDAITARLEVIAGLRAAEEALAGIAREDLAEELRWGFRRYIERRAAGSGPLVLVIEDIHWAEPALLDLVEQLAELVRGPLLILCLARPDFRELRPTFGSSAPNATAITLAPLPAGDTRRLIAELLAIDDLSESVRSEVVTRAEGNPLYVEEFLRMLIDAGRVQLREGRWVAIGDFATLDVPPTLVGLITARLDQVRPEVKQVLQRGSLVGRLFTTAALAAIGGEPVAAELLREAVRRDLLIEADERAPGEGRVHRFKHVLIRDVAYSTVPKSDRARMHDRYSRWLEETFGERRVEFGEIIAYHAEQAFAHAKDLRLADLPALGQRALDLLIASADRARERADVHAARNLYERSSYVAEAIAADPALRLRARAFAFLYRDVGSLAEIKKDVDQLVSEAERLGPSEVLFELLAWAWRGTYPDEAARLIRERLPAIARAIGKADLMVRAQIELALGAYWDADLAAAQRSDDEAVRTARATSSDLLPRALYASADTLARRDGAFSQGAAYRTEADARRSSTLSKLQLTVLAWWRSSWNAYIGDADTAVQEGERALELARELGLRWQLVFALWHLGEALVIQGTAARALHLLEEGCAIVDALGARGQIPELHARAARAAVGVGDLDQARTHVTAAQQALTENDLDSYWITQVAAAELAAAEGDRPGAERILREATARLEPTGFGYALARTRYAYGTLLTEWERAEDARVPLRAAREFFHDPLAVGWQRRIDALLRRAGAPAT
jgi:class 3 adenylate cyclase